MRTLCLLAIGIFATLAVQGQERKLTTAVYILPMASAPGAQDADIYAGVGVQNLLEQMLATDGELEETWAWWQYSTVFPKRLDVENYLKGQEKDPEAVTSLSPRWLVSGRMLAAARVAITIEDRQTAKRVGREIALDFPGLADFRRSFIAALQEAGLQIPDTRQSKMLWPEELSPRSLALAGRGYIRYEYAATEIPDFAEGLKLAPQSYILLNGQGWLHNRRKEYADATKMFGEALQRNPDGVDSLDGKLQIAAQQNQLDDARKASAEVALVRGTPENPSGATIQLSRLFQRYKHFDTAELVLQEAITKEPAKELFTALAAVFVSRADSLSKTDRGGAIALYEKALALQREHQDRAGEAKSLAAIGVSYSAMGQYAESISWYEKDLAVVRELKDRRSEQYCLELLGHALFKTKQNQPALQRFDEALTLARELKNRQAEANVLGSVAFIYLSDNQYREAIDWYQKALPIDREIKNRADEQATLKNLGSAYHKLNQDAEAIRFYEQAVTVAQEMKDRAGEARALQDLAYACSTAGRYKDAIGWYQKVLVVARELKDRKREEFSLGKLGLAYHMARNEQEAVRISQLGLAIARELKDRPSEAQFLADIAYIFWSARQYKEAVDWYEKALPVQRELKERAKEATTLHQLGLINEWLGQWKKSVAWFEPELAIRRELKDRAGEAASLYSLGLSYRRTARYDDALACFERAVAIDRELNDHAAEARALMGTGDTYEGSHQYEKAGESYEKSLVILRENKSRAYEARLLERLGSNHRQQKQTEQAVQSYQQALAIRREIKDRAGEARAIDSIAKLHEDLGESQKAIESYEQELALWRELKDSANEAATVGKLGDNYNKLGQFAKSLSYYEQGITAQQDRRINAKNRLTLAENDFELFDHVNPAVLVLPFAAGKGTGESDRAIGVALQLMLENTLMEIPELREIFLTQNIRKGFTDLGQFNAYLKGERAAPHIDGFACVVSGQVEREAGQYNLAVTIQHDDGSASAASVQVDFPNLQQVRTAFIQELRKAKCGPGAAPLETRPGALWSEPLDVIAAAALGRARADNLALLISGQPGNAAVLDEAVRLAPQSFLAVMNRAYGYQHLGRNAEAAVFYEHAIGMARAAKKQMSEVLMLVNICGDYSDINESEKAVSYGERALELAQAIKNPDAEAMTLISLAGAYAKQGQYAKSVGSYQRGLALARETANQFVIGYALPGLANAYYALSRYENAAAYFIQGVEFAQTAKDRGAEGLDLFNLGLAYTALAQHGKAAASYQQALVIARESKDRIIEGQLLYYLGVAHANLGETEAAIDDYQKSIGIDLELKNGIAERDALVGLGLCYSTLGQYEKSMGYFERSLEIARELKNRSAESDSLLRLGTAHVSLNEFGKAFDEFEHALTASREVKNRTVEVDALTQLGALYLRVHQNEKALSYYQQALAVARDAKSRPAEASSLFALGGAYYGLDRRKESIDSYNKALVIAIQVKDRAMQGRILTPIGRLYLDSGLPEQAMGHFEQAKLVAQERKDLSGEAVAEINLGLANLLLKRYELSTANYQRALTIAREGKLPDAESQALAGLMFAWAGRNQSRLAIVVGKQAVNLFQQARANLRTVDSTMQESFAKSKEGVYRFLADLLAGQGRLAEAQQVLDLLKEEELSAFVERAKDVASGQGQATLTSQEADWEKRYSEIAGKLTSTGVRRGSLLAKPDRSAIEDDELTKLEADLEVGNRAFKAFLDSMEEAFHSAKGGGEEVIKVREAEGLMETLRDLGAGTVAVYTVLGEQGFRSILVTSDVQKGYFSPIPAADLNKKILAFREVVRNPAADPVPLAKELYDLLVKPMEKDLEGAQAHTIMWSLDGALRYVPIAALYDGQHYMVERYRNVVFTPASQSRLKDAVSRNWRGLGLGVSLAHEGFHALPNVPNELHSIILDSAAGTPGVLPGKVELDSDFTKESLRSELHKHYTVVHMASHFDFEPGTDKNSYLLLGDGGKLTLDEFRSMPQVLQGVELLTLSACDTAVGGEGADGKEVEGFAVLAQRQGAKAVIATLWAVADESTTLLMREFYRLRMSNAEMTKAEALRLAQVALLTGKLKGDDSGSRGTQALRTTGFVRDAARPYAHPYFWAPFLLMGNWK